MSIDQKRLSAGRRGLVVLLFLIPPVVIALTALRWSQRLPRDISTHWTDGVVDGSTPLWQVVATCLALAVLSGTAGIIACVLSREVRESVLVVSVAGAVGGVTCSAWLSLAATSLTSDAALDTRSGALSVVGLAYALVLRGALGRLPRPAFESSRDNVEPVVPSDDGLWQEDVSSPVLSGLGFLLSALGVALLWLMRGPEGASVLAMTAPALLVILGAFTMALSRIRVTVDEDGLRVRSLLARVTLLRVRLSDIGAAGVAELRASDWGGLGYRILPGRRAVIIRTGKGISVSKKNGRVVCVTAATAKDGVALLDRLLKR